MDPERKIIVAIDGFSSSGKSTMARELAERIDYIYVDSGAMYRAATLFAMNRDMIDSAGNVKRDLLNDHLDEIQITFSPVMEDGVQHTILNGKDVEREIRDLAVSSHVSKIAEIPEVRERMVRLQQQMGIQKGIVMDGRDIGTTVFPDAELKIFVDATPEERANRRYKELLEKGEKVTFEDVYENIKQRDYIDTHREVSPLKKAEDAIEFDNGAVTREEQLEWLVEMFEKRLEELAK